MKKFILTKILCIGPILFDTASASSGQFYLKGELGVNKMQDVKVAGKKFSQSNAVLYGTGVGYYFLENLRTDLVINFSNQESKYSSNSTPQSNIKAKPKIITLMFTGYIDLFDISICEIFVGVGVGVSQIKNKVTQTVYSGTTTITSTSNKKNNLAYQLVIGTATKLTPNIKADLSYSWKNLGTTKDTSFVQSIPYRGHNITLGLRIDL
jgi:opacity protein-like surface antigen